MIRIINIWTACILIIIFIIHFGYSQVSVKKYRLGNAPRIIFKNIQFDCKKGNRFYDFCYHFLRFYSYILKHNENGPMSMYEVLLKLLEKTNNDLFEFITFGHFNTNHLIVDYKKKEFDLDFNPKFDKKPACVNQKNFDNVNAVVDQIKKVFKIPINSGKKFMQFIADIAISYKICAEICVSSNFICSTKIKLNFLQLCILWKKNSNKINTNRMDNDYDSIFENILIGSFLTKNKRVSIKFKKYDKFIVGWLSLCNKTYDNHYDSNNIYAIQNAMYDLIDRMNSYIK